MYALIGEGAFSQVFRADAHAVVRKCYRPGTLHVAEREFGILRRLSDVTNTVRAEQFLRDPTGAGDAVLVLQYGGRALIDVLSLLDDVKDVMRQIVRAVEWIHVLHVVHLDLKPDNILIDDAGTVRLCDFGHSMVLSEDEVDFASLRGKRGTESYCAPEMLAGEPYDGKKADWWSCGVIAFGLATGKYPFAKAHGPEFAHFAAAVADGAFPSRILRETMDVSVPWMWRCVDAMLQVVPLRRGGVGEEVFA